MKKLDEQLLDLLTTRATEGLSADDEADLREQLRQAGYDSIDDLDLAAAAATLAFADREAIGTEPPEGLRTKLLDDAETFFAPDAPSATVTPLHPPADPSPGNVSPVIAGGWGWAAAAVLLVALMLSWLGPGMQQGPGTIDQPIDLANARSELIQSHPDTTVVSWATPEAPGFSAVIGDVVWNDALQQGYLRLRGMPVNDPQVAQYQLWIVDPNRDSRPVDGGVFDIPADQAEVIIPIDAKLMVSEPTVFAITREQPGGVVVSDGPLLVIASA